jgi:hypothetical protein
VSEEELQRKLKREELRLRIELLRRRLWQFEEEMISEARDVEEFEFYQLKIVRLKNLIAELERELKGLEGKA